MWSCLCTQRNEPKRSSCSCIGNSAGTYRRSILASHWRSHSCREVPHLHRLRSCSQGLMVPPPPPPPLPAAAAVPHLHRLRSYSQGLMVPPFPPPPPLPDAAAAAASFSDWKELWRLFWNATYQRHRLYFETFLWLGYGAFFVVDIFFGFLRFNGSFQRSFAFLLFAPGPASRASLVSLDSIAVSLDSIALGCPSGYSTG